MPPCTASKENFTGRKASMVRAFVRGGAGRELLNLSRTQRSVVNDADRPRKYLMKFGLSWEKLSA